MSIAFAIFKEEGEYDGHVEQLLAIALNEDDATAEAERQVEMFVESVRPHHPHTCPIEVLGKVPHFTVRIGKMGLGPRDVHFKIEEAPLVSV